MNDILKNRTAFEKLFKDHYSDLCLVVKGYIKNEPVAEEIVCETFVKLWKNRNEITIKSSLKDYLVRSVANTCIDYYRKESDRLKRTVNIEDDIIVCTTLADLNEDPLDYLITSEQNQKIMDAIEKLPDRYKMTFKLIRFEDLSYDEVAREMGITRNTVKSNLREAMALLKIALKDLVVFTVLIIMYLSFS